MDFDMLEQDPLYREEQPPRRGPGPLLGFAVFLLAMAVLIFLSPVLGRYLGLWGSVAGEVLLALLPIAIALAFRMDLKEVFPLHRPKPRQVGGSLVLWMGFFSLAIMTIILVITFFPEQLGSMLETSQGMQAGYGSLAFVPLLLALAVQPAVCEEILARGFIQYTFRDMNKWVCIFLTGILFGVMHMDPIRIASASILGIGLAYLRYKTGNLVLPMLVHFVNNSLAAVALWGSGLLANASLPFALPSEIQWEDLTAVMSVGGFFWGLGGPLLIYAASILLEPSRPLGPYKYRDKRPQLILALVATALIMAGLVFSLSRVMDQFSYQELVDSLVTESLRLVR